MLLPLLPVLLLVLLLVLLQRQRCERVLTAGSGHFAASADGARGAPAGQQARARG